MRIFIICLVLVFLGLIVKCFFLYRRKKHEAFILNHSKAIKDLRQLNSEYVFFDITDYYEEHTYDNEKLYDTVSCIVSINMCRYKNLVFSQRVFYYSAFILFPQ